MNKMVVTLLGKSLLDRRFSLGLIVLALAAAVALYISVQNVQRMTRAGFENSVTNVDLVVGARGSAIQILLNSVFGIGETVSLVSAESVSDLARFPQTAWHVPVSLGDSHKGFRVIGTNNDFFRHVLAARNQQVGFEKVLDAVIGPDVAAQLGYAVGDNIVLQHGVGDYGAAHDDLPFRVVAVLARSGSPFDRALFIPLQASEAIHRGWRGGRKLVALSPEAVDKHTAPQQEHDDHHDHHGHHEDDAHEEDHHEGHEDEAHDHAQYHGPSGIDAVFVGLTDKRLLVQMQRRIAEYDEESLMAVIPGVTLAQIWQIIGVADRGFMAINLLIIGLVLLSMVAMTVLSADNRRREMAILRALGAAPRILSGLLIAEALVLSVAAAVLGIALAAGLSFIANDFLAARFGLNAEAGLYAADVQVAFYLIPAALVANLVPAVRLYIRSVNDGIMVRR